MLPAHAYRPLRQARQISDIEAFRRATTNLSVWIIGVVEDKVAIGWIEPNQHEMTSIRASNRITLSPDLGLASLADLAFPNEGGQVAVHTAQVKQNKFVLEMKKTA